MKGVGSVCKQYCSVPQCSNYRTAEITMHVFPQDKNLRTKWQVACEIGKPITNSMVVCSTHFKDEDFAIGKKIKRLRSNILPSLNLPKKMFQRTVTAQQMHRSVRIQLRNNKKITSENVTEPQPSTSMVTEDIQPVEDTVEIHAEDTVGLNMETLLVDKEVQVNTFETVPKFNIMDLMINEKCLFAHTSINFDILRGITQCVRNVLQLYNLPDKNLTDKILLILMKFKLDLSFRVLSFQFDISETTAQNYFHNLLPYLSLALSRFIYWPTKEQHLKNIPLCFQKFPKARCVLDCTEIVIQKSHCVKCRIRSYSYYKKNQTIKFLVGVTPSGSICYISPAYGGRTSDKAIFNNENVIKYFEPYFDAIMVDKGFLIEEECLQYGIEVIRPPFLKKKKQFSAAEANSSAEIARARVHVERTIQRINIFKILQNKMEWSIVPYATDIMKIICCIVNMTKPILSDEKF